MDRIGQAGGAPTVTLPNGQQGGVDENLGTGQQGTNIPALYGNAVQEELMSILAAAGVAPNIDNWGQVLQSIYTILGNASAVEVNAGFFRFYVPNPFGTPLIVQGGPCSFGSDISASQLLPVAFPHGFIIGVATDNNGVGNGTYGGAAIYGVSAGGDNQHVNIQCPLVQLLNGSIQTRGGATCTFIAVGY